MTFIENFFITVKDDRPEGEGDGDVDTDKEKPDDRNYVPIDPEARNDLVQEI